jgi:hypothetical protein
VDTQFLNSSDYETLKEYVNIVFIQVTFDKEIPVEFHTKEYAPKQCSDEYLKSIMGKYY